MTTKTKPDPAAELAPIQEQLQTAREERARLGMEARSWQDELAQLEYALSALARQDPSQFANGSPKPKTKAAEIQTEIDKRRNGNQWSDILGGSDQRVRELDEELGRVTAANAEWLARAEYEGRGAKNTLKWRKIAALIYEAADEYQASVSKQITIAFAVDGLDGLDGRDVWTDETVKQARALAERLAAIQPPRSLCLTPLTSEEPPRVRSVSGGFIGHNYSRNNAAEDQPQRVEPV